MSLSTEAPLLKTPCLAPRKRRSNKVKMLSKSLLAVTFGAVLYLSVLFLFYSFEALQGPFRL